MKPKHARVSTVLLLFMGLGTLECIPIPSLDVPSLTERSDVIVIGIVESVRDIGVTSVDVGQRNVEGRLLEARIKTNAVLKGAPGTGELLVRYVSTDEPVGYSSLPLSAPQILFLRSSDAGFTPTDPYHASLPAVLGSRVENGAPLARVTMQLGAVLGAQQALLGWKRLDLSALATIKTQDSTYLLRIELKSDDLDLRLNAAAFLILRNDIDGLGVAEPALVHPDGVPNHLQHNMAYAISEGLNDSRAIPSLTRLLRVPDSEVRRAAAAALGRTGEPSASKPLASVLGDSDSEVRYNAVIGLANITGQEAWEPSKDLFEESEEKYLGHWREWAAANGLLK